MSTFSSYISIIMKNECIIMLAKNKKKIETAPTDYNYQ